MTNRERIEANNLKIQQNIDKANALPEAGGGVEDLNTQLTEQETLISELKTILKGKSEGSGADGLVGRLNGTLETYSSKEVIKVPDYAFYQDKTLALFDCPNVTSIGTYAFYNCSALRELNCPNVTSIGAYSMRQSGVVDVNFPELLSVPDNALSYCTKMTSLTLAKATTISSGCRNSNALTKVDLGSVTTLSGSAFYYCSDIVTLIIRTNSVCTLAATNTLQGSGIAQKKGYIYVPKALIEDYKVATNWTTYANQFRAIEDYPEICGG